MNKTDPHNSNLDNSYLHNTDIAFAWSKALTSWPEFAAALSSISSTACRSPFAFNGNCKTLGKRSTKTRTVTCGACCSAPFALANSWALVFAVTFFWPFLFMRRALAVLNQTGIRYPVQIYTGTQTAAVGTPHFRSVPENKLLLLEGFCPKSAKEEEWKRKREERKRNGRGKEEGTEEGTEEARKREGKRKGPTRVLTIPQMRRSQGTKLTHKARFSPSGTRSSPRMEYRNLPHVAVSVVAPQLQWSRTLGSTVLAFGIACASGCVFLP